MKSRALLGHFALAGALAFLGGCSTVEYRSASAPIEVIESNYIESTNDAEIVKNDSGESRHAALWLQATLI
jgi:hypothetical protein